MFGLSQNKPSTVFLPTLLGYKPLIHDVSNESMNNVCRHLGYHSDQTYMYWGDFAEINEIQLVVFEVFSKNVIYVLLKEPKTQLDRSDVNHFLRDFSVKEEFGNYRAEDILKEGIENKSLTIDFLARNLNIKQPALNGVFSASSIGYNLYINGGILTDIDPTDGLNSWAKLWKDVNPDLISDYEIQAKTYWGDKIGRVVQEVNAQAQAFADTPNGFQNEYVELHRSAMGLIDFAMLIVCHYDKEMTFLEFSTINHGRYAKLDQAYTEEAKAYQVGDFVYEFAIAGGEFACFYPA